MTWAMRESIDFVAWFDHRQGIEPVVGVESATTQRHGADRGGAGRFVDEKAWRASDDTLWSWGYPHLLNVIWSLHVGFTSCAVEVL